MKFFIFKRVTKTICLLSILFLPLVFNACEMLTTYEFTFDNQSSSTVYVNVNKGYKLKGYENVYNGEITLSSKRSTTITVEGSKQLEFTWRSAARSVTSNVSGNSVTFRDR